MPKKLGISKEEAIEFLCEHHPDDVLEALLKKPFWPEALSLGENYGRYEDDSKLGTLNVCFSPDADAWIRTFPDPNELPKSLRFRVPTIGGGQSGRVRQALMFLAVAIKLDNQDVPQERS